MPNADMKAFENSRFQLVGRKKNYNVDTKSDITPSRNTAIFCYLVSHKMCRYFNLNRFQISTKIDGY